MDFSSMDFDLTEPLTQKAPRGQYEGRWRWWYSAIADWMIRNPSGSMTDCAAELKKSPNTISSIANTDLFREYLARRQQEFHRDHDYAIRHRLTSVAEASLDLMLGQLKKKGEQIPMQRLESIVGSTLDRLGYAPSSSPQVVVNNTLDARKQSVTVTGLTTSALEEARMALRLVEARNAGSSLGGPEGTARPNGVEARPMHIEASEASAPTLPPAPELHEEGAGEEKSDVPTSLGFE